MSKGYKVVITDYEYPSLENERRVLTEIGVEPETYQLTGEEEVIRVAADADALIVMYVPITRRVIEALKNCKVIVRYGAGYDNIDVEAATARGIYVAYVPDYGVEEVSNHTLALILALNRRLMPLRRTTDTTKWRVTVEEPVFRLRGQVLGIVGLGRIGSAVARKAAGFGLRLLAYDPYILAEAFHAVGAQAVEFEELVSSSDIITLHTPLTAKTYHMFGRREFQLMKPTAYIVNTARGPIVSEAELVTALREGIVAGAGLDVQEVEPVRPDNPLLGIDNVIVTGHTAWYSRQSMAELQTRVAQEVVRVLKGGVPRSLVNGELVGKPPLPYRVL